MSAEISLLINPALAWSERVVPLECDGTCLRLVTDAALTEEERQEREARLAFQLGAKRVELRTVAECPWIEPAAFAHELQKYYGTPFPDAIS